MTAKSGTRVVPTMRYDDAVAAIDWLCNAFGFERHLVVEGEAGGIAHAQLVFGNGMIMLGSTRDDDFGRLQKPPRAVAEHGLAAITRYLDAAHSLFRFCDCESIALPLAPSQVLRRARI